MLFCFIRIKKFLSAVCDVFFVQNQPTMRLARVDKIYVTKRPLCETNDSQ